MKAFSTLIGNRCENESDKLYYLERYTGGGARELVRSCFCIENGGFTKALDLLNKRYDNEFKIAECYLAKIETYPSIKIEDGIAMENFFILLTTCLTAMSNMTALNQLNSPKELMSIVRKLPYKYREMWRTRAHKLTEYGSRVSFEHLVGFINEQSSIINCPVFVDIKDSKVIYKSSLTPMKRTLLTNTKGTFENANWSKLTSCLIG